MNHHFRPYQIKTSRFTLRCWNPQDYALANKAVTENKQRLHKYMEWSRPYPLPELEILNLLSRFRGHFDVDKEFLYAIFSPDETELIGGIGFHPGRTAGSHEIGYWIVSKYEGKGIITEAVQLISSTFFKYLPRLHRIAIHCRPSNTKSSAVPQRLGFVCEGILRKVIEFQDTGFEDQMVWSLLRQEWEQKEWKNTPCVVLDILGRKIQYQEE